MADIQVDIVSVTTGVHTRVEMPDHISIRDLLPKIVKAVGGGVVSTGGSRLINKTQGFDYNDGDTLAGRGTRPDDTLGLVQEFKAGSAATV